MLDTFKQFLSTKERLPEKNLHYYVKWVSDCYRYFDIPGHRVSLCSQKEILKALGKELDSLRVVDRINTPYVWRIKCGMTEIRYPVASYTNKLHGIMK